ncbi:PAS domain-containing protein [Pseudomonas sp. GD04087]|uniref:helix-turn-helix transcriptional regulator n=1 Tax=Pseudomonas TaxID=286 RepID=UPI001F3B6A0C|nr:MULTISPECIES: PAS domain-containing protein [Pseudomonas]MCP1651175.1 DNA-binding CsgD family transcriptional regulator/PAS domain-containing protein [Pseudomonas nitroreducens]MCP1684300.1 DNA-binding CsgD family transcriptional regulator/PAS domain-containing protein [Pseudomonas nitroreducens]MDH0287601.1 PAS domain-containing protein [Pseudomonas sp. GD04087]MDH1047825.1 PAS domain-containing protein [Pseudomonas sp. GD03903]MDH1998751.1 PAS domain-containing protein [Pseudomonas sp. GD
MPRRDMDRRYDRLVGLTYECVLDEANWLPLLTELICASGRQQGALLFWDQTESGALASEINLCDPGAIETYNREFCTIDPSKGFMLHRPVGHWYHDREEYGPQRMARDPYYQEFQRPNGMHNVSCLKLNEQANSGVYLSVLTSLGARYPDAQEQTLLTRLSEHLTRAARMFGRIDEMRQQLAHRDLLLDQHPTPLWLLEGNARVLYANQAAQQRLGQRAGLFQEVFGRLHCRQHDAKLQALVRHAAPRSGKGKAGWLPLGDGSGQELLVTPVPAEANFNQPFQRPLVLLALLDAHRQSRLLGELFGLTPAEQRLGALLVRGLAPEQCAEQLGTSINTVRSQLRALFRKTHTSRQAELVSLLVRLGQR